MLQAPTPQKLGGGGGGGGGGGAQADRAPRGYSGAQEVYNTSEAVISAAFHQS